MLIQKNRKPFLGSNHNQVQSLFINAIWMLIRYKQSKQICFEKIHTIGKREMKKFFIGKKAVSFVEIRVKRKSLVLIYPAN